MVCEYAWWYLNVVQITLVMVVRLIENILIHIKNMKEYVNLIALPYESDYTLPWIQTASIFLSWCWEYAEIKFEIVYN